jgi:hypothetical protein
MEGRGGGEAQGVADKKKRKKKLLWVAFDFHITELKIVEFELSYKFKYVCWMCSGNFIRALMNAKWI